MKTRVWLLALALNMSLMSVVLAADVDGEKMLTPNQQRRILQVNHDLPTDMRNQPGDSPKVAELKGQLRQNLAEYQQVVKKFGNGTHEAHEAAHKVMDTQTALHKQFYLEEAIPAVATSRKD
jgi:hypothetical protein